MSADTAVLARVSIEEKRKQAKKSTGHSIQVQLAWCRKVCQDRGWKVYKEYVQDGGHSDDIYPELYSLLEDVAAGRVKRVVCEYYDRLARGDLLGILVHWLKDCGVSFHSSDLSDDIGEDGMDTLLGMHSGAGNVFLRKIRTRTKEALAVVTKEGVKHIGRKIAGFKFEGKHWIPDPDTPDTYWGRKNRELYETEGEEDLLKAIDLRTKGAADRVDRTKTRRAEEQKQFRIWLEEHRPVEAFKQKRVSL